MKIICDTRQKKDKHITAYFDLNEIEWERKKVEAGDYQIEDDFRVLVDTKKDLMEVCANLTGKSEHERIKREVQKAKDLGCERFIFLTQHPQIKFVEEVYTWEVPMNWKTKRPYTRIRPKSLQKIMETMRDKYEIEFLFCEKGEMGKYVYELLTEK